MSKIELKIIKDDSYTPPGHCLKSIKYLLPFYKSNRGKYMHRVRSAQAHWWDGKLHHISIHFWCGAIGYLGKGKLFQEAQEEIYCAHCEGKAIGAGMDGVKMINGRKVNYEPRY